MSVICDAGIITKFTHFNDITHIAFVTFICDALYRLCNLKNVKNFHGGVLNIRTTKIPNTDTFHVVNNTSNSSEMGNISYKGNVSSVVKFSYI